MQADTGAGGATFPPDRAATRPPRAALLGRLRHPEGLLLAVGIVLALRLLSSLLVFSIPEQAGTTLSWKLLDVWQVHDGATYAMIAQHGYASPQNRAVVFFPLFPILLHLATPLLGGSVALAGLLIAAVAAVAALTGMYRLIGDDFSAEVAGRAVVACALFPSGLFLLLPFTESLFLALAVWALILARRGRWGWVALLALLLGLTRTQGCLIALPLAWELFRQRQRTPRSAWLIPLLPVGSFLAFLAYSQQVAGWTALQAQSTWTAGSRAPWTLLAMAARYAYQRGHLVEALNIAAALLCIGLLLIGGRRLPLTYLLYAVPQLLLMVMRENLYMPLVSTMRYALVLFPCFVVIALLGRRRWAFFLWLALSATLLLGMTILYLQGNFVG